MIEMRDSAEIAVPAPVVWRWLETLPDHVRAWHPDHVSARWLAGGRFVPGAEMEVVEFLHGKLHRLRMRLTAVTPGESVTYRLFPGVEGRFDVTPSAAGTTFTSTLRMGTRLPVVGRALDALLKVGIPRRLEAFQRHLVEEGANLKALLEAA